MYTFTLLTESIYIYMFSLVSCIALGGLLIILYSNDGDKHKIIERAIIDSNTSRSAGYYVCKRVYKSCSLCLVSLGFNLLVHIVTVGIKMAN